MKESTAQKLLELNYDLYEHQAQCFSKTRGGGIWEQEIIDFVKKIPAGSSVLDLGCGNARLYQLLAKKDIKYLGIDLSNVIVSENQKKYGRELFMVGDGLSMTFKNKFDYAFCIAVLHHIPGEELQLKFLKNIHQALKPNDKFLISVWNRWQLKYKSLKSKLDFQDLDKNDTIVPWRQSGYFRYIHAFRPDELKNLAQKTGFKNIRVFASRHGQKTTLSKAMNIYLIGEK